MLPRLAQEAMRGSQKQDRGDRWSETSHDNTTRPCALGTRPGQKLPTVGQYTDTKRHCSCKLGAALLAACTREGGCENCNEHQHASMQDPAPHQRQHPPKEAGAGAAGNPVAGLPVLRHAMLQQPAREDRAGEELQRSSDTTARHTHTLSLNRGSDTLADPQRRLVLHPAHALSRQPQPAMHAASRYSCNRTAR